MNDECKKSEADLKMIAKTNVKKDSSDVLSPTMTNQYTKVIMVDLDGTLFDTREVNFRAYQKAMEPYGYKMEYNYYCSFCNGRHYLDFLPQITINDRAVLEDIHKRKTVLYAESLVYARINESLVELLRCSKVSYKLALVTTASKKNTYDILEYFGLVDLFDLILTHDDVRKGKPDPEGYLLAMEKLETKAEYCIIFEDSDVGIEAAVRSGAAVYVVKGYN